MYANQLGIAGLPSLTSNEIYNENFDEDEDEDAIGADVGEDMEEDVEPEPDMDTSTNGVQANTYASTAMREEEQHKVKKTRLVKRMVEKPKTVYERFPTFQPGKVLDFSELFKGFTVRKSRVSKRPFTGKLPVSIGSSVPDALQSTRFILDRTSPPRTTCKAL